MAARLPLDLYAEVTTADGTRYKWDANQAPGSRLLNGSFRTKTGEGFSDGSGQLARRIDNDYPDLNLVDTVTFTGADGSVAYEGRLSAMPRELSDRHSIGVTLAGWMATAKDRKFSEIYVDRASGGWGDMSLNRRAGAMVATFTPYSPAVFNDPTGGLAGQTTGWTGPWSGFKPISEAWYDAGPGNTVGKLAYSWRRSSTSVNNTDPNWIWQVLLSTDDILTTVDATAGLTAAGPNVGTPLAATTTDRRYGILRLYYDGTAAGGDGIFYGIDWYRLAAYGNHGLTLHTGETGEPDGVYASDVMRDIASRWCPQLNTSGIQASNYVIQHLAFRDRVYPYDAFLEVNKYHLWHLGVWENKTLTFRPYDLTDYDWEIRTDDPGTTFSPQGPSTESLFNGIVVTYTDALTGRVNVLTPDAYPSDLADSSTENPWNQHGVDHWDEIELSTPTIQAQALQLGRAALADRNQPKTPGTITVRGYIRDRAGNPQPCWKPRAGETIAITNFPNDSPRLIVETDYDIESKEIKLAIDRPFALLDAYLDRVGNALEARGLSV